jgi:hypothetical protein
MRIKLISVALVGAAACGTSTNPIAVTDIANQLKAALCQFQVNCGAAPDQSTCLASLNFSTDFFLTEVGDAQGSGSKIKYDGTQAANCVNEIKGRGCTFTGFQNDPKADPCSKVFTGTVAQNGACLVDTDCAGGATCNAPTGTTCDQNTMCCTGSTCGAAPAAPGAANATCMADNNCALNLYCSIPNGASSGTCKAVVTTAGGACDSSAAACSNPMYCDVTQTAPTCKTPAAHGATCVPADGLPCVDSRDFCDKTTTKCIAALTVGTTCDPTIANGGCVSFSVCDATTTKCLALGKAGSTCSTTAMTPQCLNDLQCTNGTCALPTAGMACH